MPTTNWSLDHAAREICARHTLIGSRPTSRPGCVGRSGLRCPIASGSTGCHDEVSFVPCPRDCLHSSQLDAIPSIACDNFHYRE